ncbi:hypothetical protein XH83_09340 [Bradyrhizobium sp. CCBAU 53351]|nr:hypothetical protein XH83_09340 [Bradyrhizobium sp. CCBAU 53351]
MPPDEEVPLPLGFDLVAAPVVGVSAFGVAELAAGSPVTAPRPLGAPPCARAAPANSMATIAASPAFMFVLLFARANRGARAPFRRRPAPPPA